VTSLQDHLTSAIGHAYRIERELTGGAMASVFLAEERALGRRVVLKVLAPELRGSIDAARFRREIQFAAALQHPHLVPLLVAGEADGAPFFTMPYVAGESLRERLRRDGPLPIRDVFDILADVASAMAHAHRAGVMHRDLKPENILLSEGGALVTDFGIAKALGVATAPGRATPSHGTAIGIVLGTPAYMAPEQATGDAAADHRVDLYALGVVAYEMITGRPPFADKSTTAIMQAQVYEAPTPVLARRADVPPGLAALVMKCLAKSPAERPANAEAFLSALRDAQAEADATATVRSLSAVTALPTMERAPSNGRAARLAMISASTALLAVMAGWFAAPPKVRDFVRQRAVDLVRGPSGLDPRLVVVAPFTNVTRDSGIAYIGDLAGEWITAGIAQDGIADVVGWRDAQVASAIVDSTPAVRLAAQRACDIGAEAGAGLVVTGSFYREGDRLLLRGEITDCAARRPPRPIDPVQGPIAEPSRVVEQMRKRTQGVLARLVDDNQWIPQDLEPPDYLAYVEAQEGVQAFVRGDTAEALERFRRSSRLDANYVLPTLLAGYTHADIGIFQRSADALEAAAREIGSVASRRERLLPSEAAMLDFLQAQVGGDATQLLLAAERGTTHLRGTDIAVIAAMSAVWANRPDAALRFLAQSNPSRGINRVAPGYWRWRMAALHLARRYREELAASDSALRQFPDDGDLRAMRGVTLAMLGRSRDAEREGVRQLQRGTAVADPMAAYGATAVMDALRSQGATDAATRVGAAARAALAALASDPAPMARSAWARLLLASGDWEGARTACDAPARGERIAHEMTACAGLAAARTGDEATARAMAARLAAVEAPPLFCADAALYRARILAALGDAAAALEALEVALRSGATFGNPLVRGVHVVERLPEFEGLRQRAEFRRVLAAR
jgi:serine/threonine-protein kinase